MQVKTVWVDNVAGMKPKVEAAMGGRGITDIKVLQDIFHMLQRYLRTLVPSHSLTRECDSDVLVYCLHRSRFTSRLYISRYWYRYFL